MQTLPVYTDFQSLAAMRGVEGAGESKRLDDVAGQFASVFTHMMLKSMRQASLGDGLLDSQQSLFYRDMFDQQLALSLSSGDGVGIKQMLSDHLRAVTGLEAPEKGSTTLDGAGLQARRAHAAYSAVQEMVGPQEAGTPADTRDSRNKLPLDPRDGGQLSWRGSR
jgi:flagellar protein FlgJ